MFFFFEGNLYWEQLYHALGPDAKVILTVRDSDEIWFNSLHDFVSRSFAKFGFLSTIGTWAAYLGAFGPEIKGVTRVSKLLLELNSFDYGSAEVFRMTFIELILTLGGFRLTGLGTLGYFRLAHFYLRKLNETGKIIEFHFYKFHYMSNIMSLSNLVPYKILKIFLNLLNRGLQGLKVALK